MIGQCLCTSVQFEVHGKLPNLYQCHCSLCRRQSGAASNAATIIPLDQFSWTAGESHIHVWRKPSGLSSHFCRECGSPVPNALSSDSSLMWIPVGLLDGVESEVVAHLCCDSKADWDNSLDVGARCFPEMPDDLREFAFFLKGGQQLNRI